MKCHSSRWPIRNKLLLALFLGRPQIPDSSNRILKQQVNKEKKTAQAWASGLGSTARPVEISGTASPVRKSQGGNARDSGSKNLITSVEVVLDSKDCLVPDLSHYLSLPATERYVIDTHKHAPH